MRRRLLYSHSKRSTTYLICGIFASQSASALTRANTMVANNWPAFLPPAHHSLAQMIPPGTLRPTAHLGEGEDAARQGQAHLQVNFDRQHLHTASM